MTFFHDLSSPKQLYFNAHTVRFLSSDSKLRTTIYQQYSIKQNFLLVIPLTMKKCTISLLLTKSNTVSYFQSKEYNGFLWRTNTSKDIRLKSDALLEKPKEGQKQFARRPYLGFFQVLYVNALKFHQNIEIHFFYQHCFMSPCIDWVKSWVEPTRVPNEQLTCYHMI